MHDECEFAARDPEIQFGQSNRCEDFLLSLRAKAFDVSQLVRFASSFQLCDGGNTEFLVAGVRPSSRSVRQRYSLDNARRQFRAELVKKGRLTRGVKILDLLRQCIANSL